MLSLLSIPIFSALLLCEFSSANFAFEQNLSDLAGCPPVWIPCPSARTSQETPVARTRGRVYAPSIQVEPLPSETHGSPKKGPKLRGFTSPKP